MSFLTNDRDGDQRIIRPGMGLIKSLLEEETSSALRVERLHTTTLIMQSTFMDVPERLKPFVHQPVHGALDDVYLNTRLSPEIFLDPNRPAQFSRFEKSFKAYLAILQQAPYPDEVQAESLKHVRLGAAIVRRQPDAAEFLRLILAQERRLKAGNDLAA